MSENAKHDLKQQAVPFFARYLEGQILEELSEEDIQTVVGGKKTDVTTVTTMKYPSDSEESSPPNVTLKYPSDGDDYILE